MLSASGRRVFIENKSSVTCYDFNTITEQWDKFGANYTSGFKKDGKVVKNSQNTHIGFAASKGGNVVVAHNMGSSNIDVYKFNLKTSIWKKIQTITSIEPDNSESGSYDIDLKGEHFVLYVNNTSNNGDLYYYAFNSNDVKGIINCSINKELLKKYNFLPSPENKNIVWYNRYNPFLTKFFYVYTEKPTYRYWEQNSENICLPSHNPNGFKSLSECSKNLNSFVKNKKVYVQTNSEPLHTISTTSIHPTLIETKNKISVFDLFLIFLFLLVFFFERFL